MITLYRRHATDCKVHSIKNMTDKAKRRYMDCDCAIYMNGTGDHAGRKSADTRDIKVAIAKMQAADAKSKDQAVYGLTLADAIQKFLDSREHRIKGGTKNTYSRILNGRLMTFAAEKNVTHIQQLTVDMLEDFKTYGLGDIADTSKTTATKFLRRFLKVAHQRGWLPESLATRVTAHESTTEQKQPYTDDEVTKILTAAGTMDDGSAYGSDGARFGLLAQLMLETGMRCGDAVRFVPAKCVQSPTTKLWKYSFRPMKTQKLKKKLVTAYIPNWLKLAIDACSWMSEDRPFAHVLVVLEDETTDRTLCMVGQVYQRMQAIGVRCKVTDCRPHRLRDTFAVRCLTRGENPLSIGDVSKLMGHASVTVTEKYYAAWIPEREALLEARFAESLQPKPQRTLAIAA
jgi:integrase